MKYFFFVLAFIICSVSYSQEAKSDSIKTDLEKIFEGFENDSTSKRKAIVCDTSSEEKESNNYNLGERKLISMKKTTNLCGEVGKVKIIITIDQQGQVISAKDVGGTTSSKCLIQSALNLAKSFKYEPSTKAPVKSEGTVVIQFGLK